MIKERFEFVTDAATLCVFDVAAIRHRLDDDCDWWSVPSEELKEVNRGSVVFLGTGGDGNFVVEVLDEAPAGDSTIVLLRCPSGRIFIGAGEEVTGGGLEPTGVRGGGFISLSPGTYRLVASTCRHNTVQVCFFASPGDADNAFTALPRIE